MKQITITRDEFRERIVNKSNGFGLVRAMHENPEKYGVQDDPSKLILEQLSQLIAIGEIEKELFGKEGEENGNDETD